MASLIVSSVLVPNSPFWAAGTTTRTDSDAISPAIALASLSTGAVVL